MSNLVGKKSIVFGGTSGIGLEIAKLLQAAGSDVVTVSRRGSLGENNQGMICETADVLDRDALETLFEKHVGFDYLVNAATGGTRAVGPFLEMDMDGFQASFAKLWGYTNTVRLGAPKMAKEGAIVLISGSPARKWRPGMLAIGTVGNAVEGFIKLAANEVAPIRINGVCPGLIDTPMFAHEGKARQAYFDQSTKDNLIPRVGKPEEVAQAAIFLLDNQFVTGSIVDVDGGVIAS
ncbi:MAG: SDR family oxidoreductase [Gammaproteobacteria bacterium]|nr:SDR family oxidoreductase [Gammaproteobacteria bacterium]